MYKNFFCMFIHYACTIYCFICMRNSLKLLLLQCICINVKTGFIRSWKVMEFENTFSRPGKVMDFRQNGWGHEKLWNFFFWFKYFVLFENWKINILFVLKPRCTPKRLGFQNFLVMENLNCSWKSHWILLPNICVNPGKLYEKKLA